MTSSHDRRACTLAQCATTPVQRARTFVQSGRQRRTVQMFERVLQFLARYPIDPQPPLLTDMSHSLAASIARLNALTQEQRSARNGATAVDVRRMRDNVRQSMMALVRIARPQFAFAPGTERVLQVPHARTDTSTTARHALDLAMVLTPHVELFASAGYTADFLAQFTEDARQLGAVSEETVRARQRRSKATIDIQRELDKGMGTVGVIEGMMMKHFGVDSEAMTQWRWARRVQGRMGRPRRPRGDTGGEQVASH